MKKSGWVRRGSLSLSRARRESGRVQAVLFVGTAVPPERLSKYPAASTAGNGYQYGLTSAMASLVGDAVECLSVIPRARWRRGSRELLFSRAERMRGAAGLLIEAVPYVNVLFVKQASIALGVFCGAIRWSLKKRTDRARTVMVYNMTSYLAAPAWLAARLTASEFVVVVADVPDADLDRWFPSQRLTQAEFWVQWRILRRADRLICLSARAGEVFGDGRPYLVIESGLATGRGEPLCYPPSSPAPKLVVHAGSLGYLSGIELLMSAMELVEGNVELHLYGDGPRAEAIADAARADPGRVVYHGRVPHEVALDAERRASLLASPRYPDHDVTPFTFPSKLMEYLSSGRPVISNDLGGIPDDLRRYLVIPRDASAEAWRDAIVWVLGEGSEQAEQLAREAHVYLAENKTWATQARRALDFLAGNSIASDHTQPAAVCV